MTHNPQLPCYGRDEQGAWPEEPKTAGERYHDNAGKKGYEKGVDMHD